VPGWACACGLAVAAAAAAAAAAMLACICCCCCCCCCCCICCCRSIIACCCGVMPGPGAGAPYDPGAGPWPCCRPNDAAVGEGTVGEGAAPGEGGGAEPCRCGGIAEPYMVRWALGGRGGGAVAYCCWRCGCDGVALRREGGTAELALMAGDAPPCGSWSCGSAPSIVCCDGVGGGGALNRLAASEWCCCWYGWGC